MCNLAELIVFRLGSGQALTFAPIFVIVRKQSAIKVSKSKHVHFWMTYKPLYLHCILYVYMNDSAGHV